VCFAAGRALCTFSDAVSIFIPKGIKVNQDEFIRALAPRDT
jgi:hypothetical protein